MSNYITKTVKKFRLEMIVHFFDHSDPISIVGFLATFKLAYVVNRILAGAAMWVLLCSLESALGTTLNRCMSVATNIAPNVAPVHLAESLKQRRLLQSYLEIVNNLLRRFSNGQAIIKMDFATL